MISPTPPEHPDPHATDITSAKVVSDTLCTRYHVAMANPSKGLTWQFPLRTNGYERSVVERVQTAHAECGIKISLNDAMRILIRRAAYGLPADEPSARRAILRHIDECDHCTPDDIKCPDGWMYSDAYHRVTGQREPRHA